MVFEEVLNRIQNLLEHKNIVRENKCLREQVDREYNFNHIIGESDAMKMIYKMVERVSQAVQVFEKHHIQSMLKRTGGNKTEAARLMGIDPSTLYRKMERLGISG